jgi:predicted nucleotidyltransferase
MNEGVEKTRPATLDDLKQLIQSLNDKNAPYLLIGGYALAAHGYVRATTDIDILVPNDPQEAPKVIAALMVLPDQAAAGIDPAWFAEGENIRVNDEYTIDLMLNAASQTYEAMQPYAETIVFEGIPIRTITLEGLLLTKQTVRDKDKVDRVVLERAISFSASKLGAVVDPEIALSVEAWVLAKTPNEKTKAATAWMRGMEALRQSPGDVSSVSSYTAKRLGDGMMALLAEVDQISARERGPLR